MCSRYQLSQSPRDLQVRFDLDEPPPLANVDELRPTDASLVIGPDGARLLPWGLETDWTKRPLINARAESLGRKPTFSALLEHRVLVPATAYAEWRAAPDGRKLKNLIRAADAPAGVFAFAGLVDPAAGRFTIVTCPPAPAIAHIHDRMPVILPPAAEPRWLDPARPFAEVAKLLVPYPGPLSYTEPESRQGELFA